MRKTKEYIEDLKERTVNNYEHIKEIFGNNSQVNDENKEKIE